MECRLFQGPPDCRCFAVRGRHVPTIYERDRYCRDRSGECPTLEAHRRSGRALSEDEYLQIWLPELTAT
jgi:hypothetical protein